MPNSGNTEVFYKHLLLLGLSTVNPPLHCQTSLTCLPGVRPLHPRLGRLGGLSAAGSAFAGRLGHLARGRGARRRGLALTLALDQSEVSISCQCPPITAHLLVHGEQPQPLQLGLPVDQSEVSTVVT